MCSRNFVTRLVLIIDLFIRVNRLTDSTNDTNLVRKTNTYKKLELCGGNDIC